MCLCGSSPTVTSLAGEVASKGIEFNAAVRPIDGLKLWGNIALIDAEYKDFFPFTGNTPSNIAPVIINAGASYRFETTGRAGRSRSAARCAMSDAASCSRTTSP